MHLTCLRLSRADIENNLRTKQSGGFVAEKPDPSGASPVRPTQAVESGKSKPSLELNIGSNVFRDTNGVIKLQGKEQMVVEFHPEEGQLLLTMDFYDSAGSHIAHLRRNAWAFNTANRFALTIGSAPLSLFNGPLWLKVSDRSSGDVVLEITVTQSGKIHIPNGKFYTHKGHLVEITSHYCRVVPGLTLFGDVFEARGGAASIG